MDDAPVLRCRFSDPVHPHFLSPRASRVNPPPSECHGCARGVETFRISGWYTYYYCDVCELVFHEGCSITLLHVRHPYHLEHPLNITYRFSKTEIKSFNTRAEISQYIPNQVTNDDTSDSVPDDGCDWCGEELGQAFYRCMDCGFCLDDSCNKQDPPFTIPNPKSHQHPLSLFPRPLSVPCNACGLGDKTIEPGYVCLQCNYYVHESCIDLPRVIKLTRHQHRLSLTPYLPPPARRSCGVCHRKVDVKHGMYSCNKGCSYAVHSKCATHKDIWDGVDLEGVPEEPEEDVSPFVEVGYNLIKHFTHEHHLRFDEDGINHDTNKEECQACCRPIDSSGFYRCSVSHCDFFLHALCANFPKKKEHPVHKHPLILQFGAQYGCPACVRCCSSFKYTCVNDSCRDDKGQEFTMDVVCASLSEPFEHKVHSHPLFLFSGKDSSSLCGICGEEGNNIFTLKCNECEFNMCFKCATIPVEIRYKHDEHLLTLSTGEDSSDPYWCERCERRIDPKKWFYTCDECCTTIHIDCLFDDESTYMKIGWSLKEEDKVVIAYVSNKGNSRPVCDHCGARCRYRGFFKYNGGSFCTTTCMFKL